MICSLHSGQPMIWCSRCVDMERAYARIDVLDLVADLQWALDRLKGQPATLADAIRHGQIERRLIDRAAAQKIVESQP